MPLRPSPAVDVHLTPDDLHDQLATDARNGFTAAEKWIPATWFYDDVGCELFDRITELDEYYPTRTERSILAANADEIARLATPHTVIELGSGTSEKTTLLLDAFRRAGTLRRFVPFDVSESTLVDAMDRLGARYAIDFHGVVGDFRRHLTEVFDVTEGDAPRLVVFLGGTIGNLNRTERHAFYTEVAGHLRADDRVLIGTDLVKERARIIAAYDDASGVTAAFNRNVLTVLNQRLGADFDPDRFEHRAYFHEEHERIEMRLRSNDAHHVWIDALDLAVFFSEGEEILTEISCKFTPERLTDEFEAAGFELEGAWTDPAGDFQVSLGRPGEVNQTQGMDMLLTEIDHVAIAVNDLDAAVAYYAEAFGAEVAHREVVESDGVEEALIKVADSYIQLTAATRPDSPIAKYLANRGEGLHHVGYRVDDCAAALEAMKAAGATPIDAAPRPGSRGTTVTFVHPKGSFGTLIELVQE